MHNALLTDMLTLIEMPRPPFCVYYNARLEWWRVTRLGHYHLTPDLEDILNHHRHIVRHRRF
jgi:hypothetical protein